MIKAILKNNLVDTIGMSSSSLCLIHCIITPFIFITQACSMSCCASSPIWWRSLDFFFLIISFIAVLFASKLSTIRWVKASFYVLFIVLAFTTINHHAPFINLPRQLNYAAAFWLFALHMYNRKYATCCANKCSSVDSNTL